MVPPSLRPSKINLGLGAPANSPVRRTNRIAWSLREMTWPRRLLLSPGPKDSSMSRASRSNIAGDARLPGLTCQAPGSFTEED